MDFMGDSLADGRTFRTFNLVDDFSRESPTIVVDQSLPGERIVRELDTVVAERGLPAMIVIDNCGTCGTWTSATIRGSSRNFTCVSVG